MLRQGRGLIVPAEIGENAEMTLDATPFGRMPSGEEVTLHTLSNAGGLRVEVLDYGCRIRAVHAPDKNGNWADVTLGYDTLDAYLEDPYYFGCLVGRYANRIARASFELDGSEYALSRNQKAHHLHGGRGGFHTKLWRSEVLSADQDPALLLKYHSPDGEEGYPGNLQAECLYELSSGNQLRMRCRAVTDRPTIVNCCNHSYFNLTGDPASPCLGHELRIEADAFLATDADLIPTGAICATTGTALDFSTFRRIGDQLALGGAVVENASGFDATWVLGSSAGGVVLAATARDPVSGRCLEVRTNQPGVQLYTGNFLDGRIRGKQGVAYQKHAGFCLETQAFPDSPHHPKFPSVILRPGEVYEHITTYSFTTA